MLESNSFPLAVRAISAVDSNISEISGKLLLRHVTAGIPADLTCHMLSNPSHIRTSPEGKRWSREKTNSDKRVNEQNSLTPQGRSFGHKARCGKP
ncbi:hypothetical protein GC176_27120 [bacterium]|nr:hypothetical protein [bacterium]